MPVSVREMLAASPRHATLAERAADRVVLTCGIGFSLVALATLVVLAVVAGDVTVAVSLMLYGLGLCSSLILSALYNLSHHPRLTELLRRLDHAAIYLMIAGTYTPFSLIGIGGSDGTAFVIGVWTVALAGVALKLLLPRQLEGLSIMLYLALGWSFLLGIEAVLAALSAPTLLLLLAGGLFYTMGVPIFLAAMPVPFRLAIWHGCVLVAAILHFLAVLSLFL